ncbi:Ca2+-dependent phosphoinositide-specific phospholipase C [Lunatibacter salilacus]|uniref:Ca2+-dependent phosphoinositide-specific phospholipase C n=1 Tax=Lunatibacter salilacus TaxID=2483804 RepID=UPI00131BD063|nr:Ca2+-dependent phosphoinositide-specific phospholipase C [Lunatibacter salilacus]
MVKQLLVVAFVLLFGTACEKGSKEDVEPSIKISHLQLIGSHNSYKLAIEPALLKLLMDTDSATMQGLDYSHISPWDQLELGLRVLELDVFHDPEGGRFSTPKGHAFLQQRGLTPEPYADLQKFDQPGFKVMHVQDIDFRSHFPLFRDYLEELKTWSDLNPNHLPIFITVNTKDQNFPERGFTEALPFTSEAFDLLGKEIQSALSPEKYFTPAQLKKDFESLSEAVLTIGWPDLKEIQGKFVFVLDEGGEKMDSYLQNDPSLERSVFFVNVSEDNPLAAIMILNDPGRDQAKIQGLVKKGFMVRTRADSDTREARTNDRNKMDHAFSSGAQLISTDYYLPDTRINSEYQVIFPNQSYVRSNPLIEPVKSKDISEIEFQSEVVPLSTGDFKVAMEHKYGTVLDVRTDGEVSGGCLENAIQADFLSDQFDERTKTLEKSEPILVYCKVGARSAKAAEKLIAQGFKKVYHLEGGIDTWVSSGEKVVEYVPR